jgi:hypothetical protein
MKRRTVDMRAPDCSQYDDPGLIAELKRRDPGFVRVVSIQMIGDGNRRPSDGWLFSRITYDSAPRSEPDRR